MLFVPRAQEEGPMKPHQWDKKSFLPWIVGTVAIPLLAALIQGLFPALAQSPDTQSVIGRGKEPPSLENRVEVLRFRAELAEMRFQLADRKILPTNHTEVQIHVAITVGSQEKASGAR